MRYEHLKDFTEHPQILQLGQRWKQFAASDKRVSDIEDQAGFQYVDLVQEGGGVLGIALIGATYAMEQAGIRFLNLAGTSAGAINTLLHASMGKIEEAKSEEILHHIVEKDLFDFVDGNIHVRNLIQDYVTNRNRLTMGARLLMHFRPIYKSLKRNHGLNPGVDFTKWVEETLATKGIKTTADLLEHRRQLPRGLHCVSCDDLDDLEARVVLIASEITTQTKAHFPQMAGLYWEDPMVVNPAQYLRASMSIPVFFEPLRAKNLPNNAAARERWSSLVKYRGDIPDEVKFVDGGLLSNFPINVFHRKYEVEPRLPTFGIRLSAFRVGGNRTDTFHRYLGAILSTMRHIYDFDFILRNQDYERLICRLNLDKDRYNWLDFNMPRSKKIELFVQGATKATEYIEQFDWEAYKLSRRTAR